VLKSGYTVNQTWKGIRKAWLGYTIAKNKGEDDRMVYYAEVIQKLRKELDLQPASFPHLDIDNNIRKKKRKNPTGKRIQKMTITIRRDPGFTNLLQKNLNKRYEERRRLGDSSIHVSDLLPTNCIRKQYYSRKFPEIDPISNESVHHFVRGEATNSS
jgi:hypothetical protein